MNIRVSDRSFMSLIESLFPNEKIKLFDWDNDDPIDLLIFPGGEDVSLEYYMSSEEVEAYKSFCHFNAKRDEEEKKILTAVCSGKRTAKKILGICRGMQFLAVMFGGSLFYDLKSYGLEHKPLHTIQHLYPSKLSFMKEVNSMHHQGVRVTGNNLYRLNIDRKFPSKIIATDPEQNVIEICTWMNGNALGVQFHPEFYGEDKPDKGEFRQLIYSWVNDEVKLHE